MKRVFLMLFMLLIPTIATTNTEPIKAYLDVVDTCGDYNEYLVVGNEKFKIFSFKYYCEEYDARLISKLNYSQYQYVILPESVEQEILTNYLPVINNIKNHEGLRLSVYLCPSGYPTIGYGHQLRVGEATTIDTMQAEKLLIKDFNYGLSFVIDDLINNNIQPVVVDRGKLQALAHFIYCFGTGSYYNSTLRKKVLEHLHELEKVNNNQSKLETLEQRIQYEFRRWVHINRKKSLFLLKMREQEIDWYFGNATVTYY